MHSLSILLTLGQEHTLIRAKLTMASPVEHRSHQALGFFPAFQAPVSAGCGASVATPPQRPQGCPGAPESWQGTEEIR